MGKKIKKNKSKQIQKDIKKKLMLFDRLPEECLTCGEPFDRLDHEQVFSWNVVVRRSKVEEDEDTVNLYCDVCWNKAKETVKKAKQMVEEYEKNNEGRSLSGDGT